MPSQYQPAHRRVRMAIYVALIALPITLLWFGAAVSSAAPSSASLNPLHSPQYLRKHCKIVAAVNVGGGYPVGHASGLSVEGRNTHITLNGKPDQFARRYTWQVSDRDTFCGIVGVSYPSVFTSLQPISETTHGGEYIDTSVEHMAFSPFMVEFIVYAEPVRQNEKK
jgi:hypothetical protein